MQSSAHNDDACRDNSDNPRRVEFTFTFDPKSVRIDPTPYGLVIDLPNSRHDGTPGGPDLPIVAFEAALLPGTSVSDVQFDTHGSVVITEGTPVAPLQPAAPGVRICNDFSRLRPDGLITPWPGPMFVPPDPDLYKQAIALGKQTATLTNVDASGLQPVAALTLRPIVLDQTGTLTLHTSIRVTLVLTDQQHTGQDTEEPTRLSSHAQAERWVELTKSRVINPRAVIDMSPIIGRRHSRAEYLIITDNQRWDATTMRPIGPAGGDLVAEFERLAAWKRMKGYSARVITISEIVSGAHGTFAGSCRCDLQEVLREFVKFAHASWGTAWLLLGGDIQVVPARSVVGYVGGFSPGTKDPPDPGTSFWTGTFLKIRADVAADTTLIRASDGQPIPYDAAGTSSSTQLGWIFTDATYTMRSTMPTGYVRVNGPAGQANTELFWLTDDKVIPTDLYYADVAGYPERLPNGHFVTLDDVRGFPRGRIHLCGGHDWDSGGNGLYGQWNGNGDLDGVRYRADVSVGRAPVESAAEAKTFVDKVLAYERAGGWFYWSRWLSKLLIVSANWGGRAGFGPADPLIDNTYIKRPADDHAVIQMDAAWSPFNHKLISVVTDADQRQIPFHLGASAAVHGWRFAISATNPSPSMGVVQLPWGPPIQFPIPTRWIVVYGAAAEMAPQQYILDNSEADGSMLDQEQLRQQLAADVPEWSDVGRLYEDEIDLPPAAVGASPLAHLTGERMFVWLNEGQHIVSLSGHGWWGGCCGLEPSMRTTLTNGGHTFIAYADSCYTNQFEVDDAISESLLNSEHGGAVAYVGSTRYSWIGVGDDFQRSFFKGLPATRALGLLHDRRLAMIHVGTGFWPVFDRWSIFSLNLIGDPEMRVWTRRPRPLCIEVPDRLRLDQLLTVQVLLDERAVFGAVVTVQQQGFSRQARTDATGDAHFDLDGAKSGDLSVTVFHRDGVPMTAVVQLRGPVWIEGRVISIRAWRDEVAAVLVKVADGERTLSVLRGATDLLALLGQGLGSERTLRRLVSNDDVIEAAEVVGAQGSDA